MIGSGVLKGMGVVFRQFLSTYPIGRFVLKILRLQGDGLFTVEYPETKQEHSERFRYFPFLVYDDKPDNLRCVACNICAQECPPKCMDIVMQKDEAGRPAKEHGRTFPAKFDIDMAVCMSCKICVDVCPFDAIEMDNQYELAGYKRDSELLFNKDDLLKSADYFKSIKPTESAEVTARLDAKRKKTAPPQPPQESDTEIK